ncbi:FUSC family protein, partial [Marinobacter sp. BW6]
SGLQGEGMVLLLRPLVVDLLEATGTEHEDAAALLPRL